MVEETSESDEHEVRMIALERKFDKLLNFVHLMVRQDTKNENRRRDDNKDTNDEVPKGHPHANTGPPPIPPRPPTPPKPEEKDSQISSKIDSLKEKIRLM